MTYVVRPEGAVVRTDMRARASDTPSPIEARRREDARLVEAAAQGDESAFAELYGIWFDRAHSCARRVLADDAAAADSAQDAFLRAWRKLDSLQDPGSFGPWLLRIARNEALSHRRKHARVDLVDVEGFRAIEQRGASAADAPRGFRVDYGAGGHGNPEAAAVHNEAVERLSAASEALSDRDAIVLTLSLRHGFMPKEVGQTLGISANVANQVVHRLRKRLARALRVRHLWERGPHSCRALGSDLSAARVERFDAQAVSVLELHAADCQTCV